MNNLFKYGFVKSNNGFGVSEEIKRNYPLIAQNYFTKYYEANFDCVEDAGGHGWNTIGLYINEFNNDCLVLSSTCLIGCCGIEIYSGQYDLKNILEAIKKDIVDRFGNNIFVETVKVLNQQDIFK
jgi:hypothetical protein